MPRFDGSDYEPELDDHRLTPQHDRVKRLMSDHHWRTLAEISAITGDPPASVSAQLRHLRKPRFGGYFVKKRSRGDRKQGLYEYKVLRPMGWTKNDWGTPKQFVRNVERWLIGGGNRFEIDPCCSEKTKKAPVYFTKAENGLTQEWDGRTFMNPPYGNPLPWCRKAARQVDSGVCPLVCALLPPAIDTGWFHDWVLPYAQVVFVKGRIHFLGPDLLPVKQTRQGNIVAVYSNDQNLWLPKAITSEGTIVEEIATGD